MLSQNCNCLKLFKFCTHSYFESVFRDRKRTEIFIEVSSPIFLRNHILNFWSEWLRPACKTSFGSSASYILFSDLKEAPRELIKGTRFFIENGKYISWVLYDLSKLLGLSVPRWDSLIALPWFTWSASVPILLNL